MRQLIIFVFFYELIVTGVLEKFYYLHLDVDENDNLFVRLNKRFTPFAQVNKKKICEYFDIKRNLYNTIERKRNILRSSVFNSGEKLLSEDEENRILRKDEELREKISNFVDNKLNKSVEGKFNELFKDRRICEVPTIDNLFKSFELDENKDQFGINIKNVCKKVTIHAGYTLYTWPVEKKQAYFALQIGTNIGYLNANINFLDVVILLENSRYAFG